MEKVFLRLPVALPIIFSAFSLFAIVTQSYGEPDGTSSVSAVPTTLNDFTLPGSQPLQSSDIKQATDCDCHGQYDIEVEPMFNWQGSMMAHALRDMLYWATVAIANQDAPESGDLCIRCHTPKGWLEGRSTPTDGSALLEEDRDGVVCHFCHKMIKPFPLGTNPYPGNTAYTTTTYLADTTYMKQLAAIPSHDANGGYVVDDIDYRRGPYADPEAPHDFYYSPFHQESALCGTCHDVSNPAFSRTPSGDYVPNDFDTPPPDDSPYAMFPVERTYSEWLKSAYNSPEGVYAPQFGGNKDTVRTCQDCHMRDVTGKGAQQGKAPIRDDLPLHDMTGGNTFVPLTIATAFPSDPINLAAIDSGIARATRMLQAASTMSLGSTVQGSDHQVTVTITNETGHKLPSGYPEGRRMWINVRAYAENGSLLYESGAYDQVTAVLTHDADVKIYEVKPGISNSLSSTVGIAAGPSFHFVLNDTIYSDNRIPPRGYTFAAFDSIQSPPVGYSYPDGQYWDDTDYLIPGAAAKVVVAQYYQTTSKEYVEFLRDENVSDTTGDAMYSLWMANGMSTPVVMNRDSIPLTPITTENQPPVLASIGPRSADEDELVEFGISATDADGVIASLDTANVPSGAAFVDSGDGAGSFSWTPAYDQAGVYNVTFFAYDDSGAVDNEVVEISVSNVNRLPLIDPTADQQTVVGQLLSFTVGGNDPDGDSVGLTSPNTPSGATLIETGWNVSTSRYEATFGWTPSSGDEGVHAGIRFVASDGSLQVEDSVTITVTADYCCGAYTGGQTGNVDYDPGGVRDLSDILTLASYAFLGGVEPPCLAEGNVNGDPACVYDLSDVLTLASFAFLGGADPALCLPDCELWGRHRYRGHSRGALRSCFSPRPPLYFR